MGKYIMIVYITEGWWEEYGNNNNWNGRRCSSCRSNASSSSHAQIIL